MLALAEYLKKLKSRWQKLRHHPKRPGRFINTASPSVSQFPEDCRLSEHPELKANLSQKKLSFYSVSSFTKTSELSLLGTMRK